MSQAELNVTPNALKVFQDVINKGEEVDPSNALVRVMIAGKTATEYEYTMGIAEKDVDPITHARDDFYEFDDVTLVVDDVSINSLKGSTIDYKETVDKIGFVIDNPNKPIWNVIEKGCQQLLDEQVNPQVAMHNGRIDVISFNEDDGILYIEMKGGCQGCASSALTLQQGVENLVFDQYSEVYEVKDMTDHESGENPYYER